MLQQFLIFTKGGLVLWRCAELGDDTDSSPIDALIRSCFLEDRLGAPTYAYNSSYGGAYTLKWAFNNELDLVFVAVYRSILRLLYVDALLALAKQEFSAIYDPNQALYNGFDGIFWQLKNEAEARVKERKLLKSVDVRKGKHVNKNANSPKEKTQAKSSFGGGHGKETAVEGTDGGDYDKLRVRSPPDCDFSVCGQNAAVDSLEDKENKIPDNRAFNLDGLLKLKKSKVGRKADNVVRKESKVEMKKNMTYSEIKLDFSDPIGLNSNENISVAAAVHGKSMMDSESKVVIKSNSDYGEKEPRKDVDVKIGNKGWLSSIFDHVAGKSSLEKADLELVLNTLKDKLMSKNVAEEIAQRLCESVSASLEGKKLASWRIISSTVQAAMGDAIVRVFSPNCSVDILRDIYAAKEQKKPYIAVFVGVNGVGKSTNLAKVAYWLKQHNISVMMAACDTFRSGAIEQLRVHAHKLQIPLFEKGYNKDPANIAREAKKEATRNGSDVVLIDTAGRMQDNEPLMRSLSKLVYVNKPDLILFVGEALAGNDAVNQLSKFNEKLADFSPHPYPRLIDGILLSKFDTIDDKVGAALSMAYISGSPVMFVGCGQSYTDLKKLDVQFITSTLLK